MEKTCIKCSAGMKCASLSAGGGYILAEEKKKGSNRNVSRVNTYVCPKCGYIELFAEKPDIFDK